MKHMVSMIVATVLCSGTAALAQSPPVGLKRTDLQRHDLSIKDREAIQTRVDFAPGAISPWHSHPGEELIYVPEGTLEFQIQGQEPVVLKAGDVYFIPAGAMHMARNRDTMPSVELATYIVEKGKPLLIRADNLPTR